MVRNGDKIEAHSWNAAAGKWEKIGDVVGGEGGAEDSSASGKRMFEGKVKNNNLILISVTIMMFSRNNTYMLTGVRLRVRRGARRRRSDAIHEAAVQRRRRPLVRRTPVPRTQRDQPDVPRPSRQLHHEPDERNQHHASRTNSLRPLHRSQFTLFLCFSKIFWKIHVSLRNCFAGGGRYIPGVSGQSSAQGGLSDPFTGGGRYVPGSTPQSSGGGDLVNRKMMHCFHYCPIATPKCKCLIVFAGGSSQSSFFPQKHYLSFESGNVAAIIGKHNKHTTFHCNFYRN